MSVWLVLILFLSPVQGEATALGPAPGDLLVANFGGGDVTWYDGTTGAYGGVFVPEGRGGLDLPVGLAFGPDGALYVSSAGTNQVLRYNGQTGKFLDVFAEDEQLTIPSLLRFGPEGDLYVGTFQGGRVLRFEGTSGALEGVVASGLVSPIGLAFDGNGRLYVASAGEDRIARFEDGVHVDDVVAGGELVFPAGLELLPGGGLLVASLESGELLHYDLPSGTPRGSYGALPDGTGPAGIAVDATGRIWVSDLNGDRLLRVDAAGEAAVVLSAEGLRGPEGIAFKPDQ